MGMAQLPARLLVTQTPFSAAVGMVIAKAYAPGNTAANAILTRLASTRNC
jgi:hypothetical protein